MRLNGTNFDYGGRVEIFYRGKWGKICRKGWEFNDVKVVCTQLGFKGAVAEFITSEVKNETLPYLMTEVSCSGKELTLSSCKRTDGENDCPNDKEAQALCEPSRFIAHESYTAFCIYQINTVQCNVLNVRITVTNIFILPNSGLFKISLLVAFFKKELAHLEPTLLYPGPALDNFSSPVIIH